MYFILNVCIITKDGDVEGGELDSLKALSERRMLSRLWIIFCNASHQLHDPRRVRHKSSFSKRHILPRC